MRLNPKGLIAMPELNPTAASTLPHPLDVLRDHPEPLPEWLEAFNPGDPFPLRAFLASRMVYYPGSGTDGHPLWLFGISRAAHCFVYADYMMPKSEILEQLLDEHNHEHPTGFRVIHVASLGLKLWPSCRERYPDLLPDAICHFYDNEPTGGPFVLGIILERLDTFGENHGPKRIAMLHAGWDAYATFEFLFCELGSRLPYAILLQDHGYGCNWNRDGYGDGSLLWRLARKSGRRMPAWLLAASNTRPWTGYSKVSSGSEGGINCNKRSLFHREDTPDTRPTALAQERRTRMLRHPRHLPVQEIFGLTELLHVL